MDLSREINIAVDELRDAASTTFMHDAKNATRCLYKQINADDVLPGEVRQELAGPLESAWSQAVAGGGLFERTHGAIRHLDQASRYLWTLLAQGTQH
jgi:hypothetical protein